MNNFENYTIPPAIFNDNLPRFKLHYQFDIAGNLVVSLGIWNDPEKVVIIASFPPDYKHDLSHNKDIVDTAIQVAKKYYEDAKIRNTQ